MTCRFDSQWSGSRVMSNIFRKFRHESGAPIAISLVRTEGIMNEALPLMKGGACAYQFWSNFVCAKFPLPGDHERKFVYLSATWNDERASMAPRCELTADFNYSPGDLNWLWPADVLWHVLSTRRQPRTYNQVPAVFDEFTNYFIQRSQVLFHELSVWLTQRLRIETFNFQSISKKSNTRTSIPQG